MKYLSKTPLLACGFAILAGCGVADYEKKMTTTLAKLREESNFNALYDEAKIDDHPITMRLPSMFVEGDWFRHDSSYRGGEKIAANRVFPPFLESLPGHNRTGEAFTKAPDGQRVASYCYLCVIEPGKETFKEIAAKLHKQIKGPLPDATDWEEVECTQSGNDPVRWHHLRPTGSQLFAHSERHGVADKYQHGTFDAYLHDAGGFIVLLAVRMPDVLEGRIFLLDIARASAATLKSGESEFRDAAPAGTAKPADEKSAEEKPADADASEATSKK